MTSADQGCFLRTITSEGGVSHLAQLCPPGSTRRVVYLKSGGGRAATRLMERVGEKAGDAEYYWDAPGKERLCAVRIRGLCLLDADAPFPLEPKLPGAGEELLSLDGCRDNVALRAQQEELRRLHGAWHRELLRAARFLRAAQAMKRDMRHVAAESLDSAKLERYASRFAARRFPAPNGHVGNESRRFLTAVTGQGLLLRRSGLEDSFAQAVVLEDEYDVAAPALWNLVRAYALGNGLDAIACPCALLPGGGPEHLLLPGIGLACVTANRRHPIDLNGAQHIQAGRFFDKEALRNHSCRLRFCRRTMREMLAEAYQAQAAAELLRAELDAIYAAAELPGALEALAERVLQG
ncbi:MAG: hypothetical protein LBG83_04375 [Oscillospiraceae bacterium]|jgi:hypothetical protein|nr:hypothetical protein [Oscillospiraceae bacterium]